MTPGGVVLHTRTWLPEEPGSGPRLVVVHGLGDHAGRYDEMASRLAARGVAVMAYDQRGHGRSDGKRGVLRSFGTLLDDLDRMVAHARDTLPGAGCFVLGHSMGGLVVLRWLQARRPPVDGAVLSAPWLGTAGPVPAWKSLASRLLRPVLPDLTLSTGVDPEVLTRDPAKRREWEEDPWVHDRISPGLHGAALEAQGATLAERPDPDLPLLFLVPLADGLVDAEVTLRYARSLPGPVDVVALEDTRHEPMNDLGRDAVYDRVADWLTARAGAEPPSGARVSP